MVQVRNVGVHLCVLFRQLFEMLQRSRVRRIDLYSRHEAPCRIPKSALTFQRQSEILEGITHLKSGSVIFFSSQVPNLASRGLISAALPTPAATARAGPSNGPSAFSPGHTPASMSTAWTDQDEAGGREGGEIHDPAGAFVGSAVISGAGGQGRLSLGPYLEFVARVTSHIPDKGQVMVRYYGLYANAHIYRSSEADVRGGEAPALQSSWLP